MAHMYRHIIYANCLLLDTNRWDWKTQNLEDLQYGNTRLPKMELINQLTLVSDNRKILLIIWY